jgi:uncharacterized membrane protein YgcG
MDWADSHPSEVARIVGAANRFALTYTTYYARLVYWVYALHAYKGVFEDQEEFFATRGAGVRDLMRKADRARAREAEGGGDGGPDGGGGGSEGSSSGGSSSQGSEGTGGKPTPQQKQAPAGRGANSTAAATPGQRS